MWNRFFSFTVDFLFQRLGKQGKQEHPKAEHIYARSRLLIEMVNAGGVSRTRKFNNQGETNSHALHHIIVNNI